MNRHDYRKKKAKKSRTVVKVLLMFSIALLVSLTTYGVYLMKKAESAAESSYETAGGRTKSDLRDKDVEPLRDNVSILFIGVDDSEKRNQDGTDTSLSDALMFTTLNHTEHSIKWSVFPETLISIFRMRDMRTKLRMHTDKMGLYRPLKVWNSYSKFRLITT